MKPQLIIYTRNQNVDYRMIVSPNESLCPPVTRKYFRDMIRGALNIETYDDPLTSPRWVLVRKDDCILFGVAELLVHFSSDYHTDYTGRGVRGFFGLVYDAANPEINLPLDVDFFKRLNEEYIVPLWTALEDQFIRVGIEIDIDTDNSTFLPKALYWNEINFDPRKTVILGETNPVTVLAEAFASNRDVSVVTGFNNKNHAYAPTVPNSEYRFMNVLVNGVTAREERINDVLKRNEVPKAPEVFKPAETRDVLPNPGVPKKANRPKSFLTAVLLIAALIIALILLKKCAGSSENLPSSILGVEKSTTIRDSTKMR